MEHLFLPRNPTPPPFKVPYVCKIPYDGGLFSEYPNRVDKSWMLPGEDEISSLAFQKHLHPESTTHQESFFQTWLFFGLLSTMFGPLYREDDFLVDENGTKFITTAALIPKMEEASKTRVPAFPADQRAQFLRVVKCIHIIWVVIRLANDDFDWRVKLSIISVASFFAETINLFAKTKGISIDKAAPETWKLDFPHAKTRSHMLSHGWCPSEIAGNIEKFNSLHTLFFLSRVDRSYLRRSHVRCTERLCNSYQIDPAVYTTKHTESSCTCRSVEVDADEVFDILRTGALPLIKVTGDEYCTGIEIVASKAETHYIAISHVWADGLGNPNANALPSCQLRRLKRLVTDLSAKDLPVDGNDKCTGPVLFWIDTLCCPSEQGEAKDLSITRIRETYTHATTVLVLDSGLQQTSYHKIHPIEAVLSIATSGWTQRLWTLQEGALAASEKLWVQFKDGSQNLDVLYRELGENVVDDNGQRIIEARIFHIRRDMKVQFGAGIRMKTLQSLQRPGENLMILDRGLIHRSVSVPSDEPLCIATLLDLDLEEVLRGKVKVKKDDEEGIDDLGQLRMCKVWQLIAAKLHGIPEGILGLGYPRLQVKGFRWAPRTLLETNSNILRDARWLDPALAQLTPHGLRVIRHESFLVNLTPSEDASSPDFSSTLEDEDTMGFTPFIVAGGTRYWMLISKFIMHSRTSPTFTPPLLRNLFHKPLAILKLSLIETPPYSEALLGNIQLHPTNSGEFIFSQIMPISIRQSFPDLDIIYNSAASVMKARRKYRRYIETFKCPQAVDSDLIGKTIQLARIALRDPEVGNCMRLVYNVEGDEAVHWFLWCLVRWFSFDGVVDELGRGQVWYVD